MKSEAKSEEEGSSPSVPRSVLEQPASNSLLDLVDSLLELLGDGLTLESLDGVGMSSGGHDDEGDDCGFRSHLLEEVV